MWDVQLLPRAEKALRKLDRRDARRVRDKLMQLASADDPTGMCKALSGPLTWLWRYRIGDWRVIVDIRRDQLVIIALDIGHRSEIYG